MNATRQAMWMFLALISLASSAWYFASPTPIIRLDDQSLSMTTDTIIHHLTVQQFDTDGRRIHYLQTPLMRHIPSNNTHQLKTPHIIVIQQNQPAWDIQAKNATALYGGKQITFNDNVVVYQKKEGDNQETTLKTEEITYFPNDKLATTHKDITFIQAGNLVQSTGMTAYLAENRVKLLNNARGTYESNHG